MVATLKEFLNSLKPKEKIMIISSMAALGVVLVGVVLLIAFCGKSPDVAPQPHEHKFDYSLELVNGKFNLNGKCSAEGCDEPELLIKNVDAKVESTKPASCTAKGEVVYAYTHDGKTVKYTVYSDKTQHMLGGKTKDEFDNPDGTVNYDVEGIKIGVNVSYVCEGTVKGHFVCDGCNQLVSVDVYKPSHTAYDKVITPATCTSAQKVQTVCSDCGETLSDVFSKGNPEPHNYKYSLNASKLSAVCQNGACQDKYETTVTNLTVKKEIPATCKDFALITYTATAADGKTVEFTISGTEKLNHTLNGVDATSLTNSDGTYDYRTEGIQRFATSAALNCGDIGSGYYTCEKCAETVRVTIKKPPHQAYLSLGSDLVKPTFETPGIIYTMCKNEGCDLRMNEELPIVVIGEGGNAIITTPATDSEAGLAQYTYTTKLGLVAVIENVIYSAPLGHNYGEYTAVPGGAEGTYIVSATCKNEDCNDPELSIVVSDVVPVGETAPNCTFGTTTYYKGKTSDGSDFEYHIVGTDIDDGAHMFNGVFASTLANPDGSFNYDIEGIKLFDGGVSCGGTANGYYVCEACREGGKGGVVLVSVVKPHDLEQSGAATNPTITEDGSVIISCKSEGCEAVVYNVILPAIVLDGEGKNAELISEETEERGVVVKYTYVTDFGYTVELEIELPKTTV